MEHARRLSLDVVEVARPCTADWLKMRAVDRGVRHCGDCRLNVYDLAQLTRGEAERVVGLGGCVRLTRRADGTVVTRDCEPVRLAIRRGRARARLAVAAMLAACGTLYAASPFHRPAVADRARAVLRLDALLAWIDPWEEPPPVHFPVEMGDVAAPVGRVAPPPPARGGAR